jgi:hypothetical protein
VKVLRILRIAWYRTLSLYRIGLIWFFCNLVFALIIAIPFNNWLKNAAGYSLEISRNAGKFDFTFLGDLMRNHQGWSVLVQQAGMMLFVYFLFAVFMMGGVLECITGKMKEVSTAGFFRAGFNWFWKLLGLTCVFLGIHLVLISIAVAIVFAMGADPFQMENDVAVMFRIQVMAIILGIFMTLVLLVQHYSKLFLVRSADRRVFHAIGNSVRFVRKNFGMTLLLMLIASLFFLTGYFLFRWIRGIADDGSGAGIFLLFLTGQAFLLWRIAVKLIHLCAANALSAEREGHVSEPPDKVLLP